MKTENLPLKIDCFKLRNYRGGALEEAAKEHIGYVLVPVRNIAIYPLMKACQVKPRWHKLVGLTKDWRMHRPELMMNLMITEKNFLTTNKCEMLDSKDLDAGDLVVLEENPSQCMLKSQVKILKKINSQKYYLKFFSARNFHPTPATGRPSPGRQH